MLSRQRVNEQGTGEMMYHFFVENTQVAFKEYENTILSGK